MFLIVFSFLIFGVALNQLSCLKVAGEEENVHFLPSYNIGAVDS